MIIGFRLNAGDLMNVSWGKTHDYLNSFEFISLGTESTVVLDKGWNQCFDIEYDPRSKC